MKTLHNHVILYDADCPMCNAYTKAFVTSGMLDPNGRIPFSPGTLPPEVDARRACNEIALVNCLTREVTYGKDSLFKILAHRFTFLKPLFELPAFRVLVSHLYAFISFNRKVIAPHAQTKDSCTPSFNRSYRIVYLIFTWIVTAILLTNYAAHLPIPATTLGREFLICGGQLIFQGSIVCFTNRNRVFDYLGNLMTVSLAGGLLLLPVWVIAVWYPLPAVLFLMWFTVVVSYMFFMHLQRVKLMRVSGWLSVTWLVYRLLVVVAILLNQRL